MLFKADNRQNFTLEEVDLEKQKSAKKTFTKKLKTWNKSLRYSWIKLIGFRPTGPRASRLVFLSVL